MTTTPQTTDRETPVMLAVYRHDVHKLRGRAHEHATVTCFDTPVNEPVPLGADADAATLARPAEGPEQTVANHATPQRLTLTSGQPAPHTPALGIPADGDIAPLVTATDPARAHARWLTSPVPAAYNESAYYPYTSVQYHTLVTAALLDAYRAGYAFDDLQLVATPPSRDTPPTRADTTDAEAALTSEVRMERRIQSGINLGTSGVAEKTHIEERFPQNPIPESVYVHDTCAGLTKIIEDASWEPEIDFEEGIRRVCALYQ